jgi:clan AA aspartic protease
VTGIVDDAGRAIVPIQLRHPVSGVETPVGAWIDTGFTGDLVLPAQLISSMGLPLGPAVSAVLADGSVVQLDTYTCMLEWFGQWKSIEVVVNKGQFPLLGVGLLLDHELRVDYPWKTVNLT